MDSKQRKDENLMTVVLFWPMWVPGLIILFKFFAWLYSLGRG